MISCSHQDGSGLPCTGRAGHPGPHTNWAPAQVDTVTLTRQELSDLLVSAALVGAARGSGGNRSDVQRHMRTYPHLRDYVIDLEA